MILIKIHKTPNGDVIAMCDKDIIGKTFEDKDMSITVSERFYKGEEVKDKIALLKLIKSSHNLNIIGKESIDLALKNHIIEKESIIRIKDIPHSIKIEI